MNLSLLSLLTHLEHHISNSQKFNLNVSNNTIGWQIDHSLMVINGIIEQLETLDSRKFQPKWSFSKFLVFTTGNIPRGKAKAPKMVTPIYSASQKELFLKLELAKNNCLKLATFPKNSFFKHPYFHDLNVKQAERFLVIHTKHHLKIIIDILK